MRFPRTALLASIGDPNHHVVLVEAPSGTGKSFLLRRGVLPGAVRVAASDVRSLLDGRIDAPCVVIDDADQLSRDEISVLVDFIESADDDQQVIVAGRLVDEAVLEAVDMVDGLVIDAASMMISPAEVVEATGIALPLAEKVVDLAGGNVRLLARALDRLSAAPESDVLEGIAALTRTAVTTTMSRLEPRDAAIVRLVARVVTVDRPMLDRVADDRFVQRAVLAGVPLQHESSGGLFFLGATAFVNGPLDGPAAERMASALIDRERRLEAVHLLLDAGDHPRAADEVSNLPSSTVETMEARSAIALINRFGAYAEQHPALLLLRAEAQARIGRRDRAWADVQRAEELGSSVDAPAKRRIDVEVAELRLSQGHRDEAMAIAERILAEAEPGEEHSQARACTVLAEAAVMLRDAEHLQAAAELFATAAATWTACGEPARARICRCNLVSSALVPLGRFDEALGELHHLLSIPDLSDNERSWLVLIEGFSLFDAGREAIAGERFARAADLGQILDNPRILATAAWGRALVAARRYDLAATLQWIHVASNTGLGPADDILGVSYLCDITIALGALGEMELAKDHLARAQERPSLSPDLLECAEFITRGRTGLPGDIEVILRSTPPAQRWRVQLIGALGSARAGDLDTARALRSEAERELVSLGLGNFEALGERAAEIELNDLLQVEVAVAARAAPQAALVSSSPGRRLSVIGSPMSVTDRDGVQEVPAGNAQRLVGVVAARGGVASIDTLAEAMWPDDDLAMSRARLRNVLMRLRRGAGSVLVRTGTSIRLAADVRCDLHEFLRRAADAQSAARTDPDVGGHLAAEAVTLINGEVFADFEYEEWALAARQQVDQMMLSLLDLLSVQAEDAGDLATAQHLAERALRLDRYTDSRYIRLAELLTLQGRNAAAATVLEDASIAAREHSPMAPEVFSARRRELRRQAGKS
jgi:DNA-binding SARP family transcriptional activator